MRRSGMLLPIAGLPSPYGIGCFSKEAYEFVDMLERADQTLWQILPLGPTGYGDSPYQSFSTFAGNPYFIDLNQLIGQGLLTTKECEKYDWGNDKGYIDYQKIYESRFKILRTVFERSEIQKEQGFCGFCKENAYWLLDYALYMAVKNHFGGKSWSEWDEDIRLRKPEAMESYGEKLSQEVLFYQYLQFVFANQWGDLKSYANRKGISIIGDIPIYVAFDSADTWANPALFQLDENNEPVAVAGCPPDGFSATGQLWGNPLYRWEYHRETQYSWWVQRTAHCFKLYDIVRIDHFRGFDEYYAIPYGNLTAENGKWLKGPGIELFEVLRKRLGKLNIIAEDLGYLTDSVRQLLKESGYPGMKVLEFAFDSREESDYLPHNYERNCIVYTGTHDNDTLQGWYESISEGDRNVSVRYLNNQYTKREEIHWDFVCLAMRSVADTCVIPVQDYLGLGHESRINTPSTLGNNWIWRMQEDAFSDDLVARISNLTKLYSRGRSQTSL